MKIGILDKAQYQFIQYANIHSIEYGDATKKLPIKDGSVDILYSSHMIEHLDQEEAALFLKEARRVLRSGGIIRLAIPGIHKQVQEYIKTNDADYFIHSTYLTQPRARTLLQRLKIILMGTRHHQWMYNATSLSSFLQAQGFTRPIILQAGESQIGDSQRN